ncbi:hypothetical protein ACFST9_17925 [Hymenobacter monticola]|uniref:Replication initiation protein n=1 Tax=Hymenobacter monticola TaxID=1705399 RepID=A0ABY4B085_9BACT|nr:hypothetical protein [Hymenobacter monticola]UOE32214.1 hypothetical protein MTP16_13850 [Hymenobacter monticola]
MPDVINRYAINVDLHRVHVQPATTLSIDGPAPVDLFTLTYSESKDSYTAGEFTVEKERSNDAAYHLRLNISYRGQPFAFMLTDRTKKYGFSKNLRPLHVTNEAFYTLSHGSILAAFLRAFGLEIANHSQLDICLYTQQCDPAKLIQRLTGKNGKYQRILRKNDKAEHVIGAKDATTGKLINTTYYGKDSETVTVKIYDKSHELQGKPKQYISDWHLAHGLDPTKPVYSLEISIKARALKEYRTYAVSETGEQTSVYRATNNNAVSKASKQTEITSYNIEIEKLNNPAYLSMLLQQFWPIDIRKKDATRPTNCTRISLIDWTIYPTEAINKTVAIRPTTNTLAKQKKMLKDLVTFYAETGIQSALDTARAIAARDQLTETLAKLLAKIAPESPAEPQQLAA